MEAHEHQGGDLETHGLVDVLHDMTRFDARRIRLPVERHARFTGSTRAREILERWDHFLPRFVKVMPIDYRRALEQMAGAREPGSVERRIAAGGR